MKLAAITGLRWGDVGVEGEWSEGGEGWHFKSLRSSSGPKSPELLCGGASDMIAAVCTFSWTG